MVSMIEPSAQTAPRTLRDLLARLGVAAERVRLVPAPGTASEADLSGPTTRRCELVDQTLVEKAMGFRESILAGLLIELLRAFVVPRNLGLVTGPDGQLRLFSGLVRAPDVAFVAWSKLPGGRVPAEPVPTLAPDLAVEVLSPGNSVEEMRRKRREYFQAGVAQVWEVDLRRRRVTTYRTADDDGTSHLGTDVVRGQDALQGFEVLVDALFAELDRQAPAADL